MSIDPRYIADLALQQYLVDKDTGLPLAGGQVSFFRDASRTDYKDVYQITGTFPSYSFTPLPNPITLSAVGTMQDADGNDIIPYYLPLFIDNLGNITSEPDLYYVVVTNFSDVPQFTREAWPPNAQEEGGGAVSTGNLSNYIPNGQFLAHNNYWNTTTSDVLPGGSTVIAQGGWTFELPDIVGSTNLLTFPAIGSWVDNPPASPPYQVRIQCTSASSGDNIKSLRIKFDDVNKFSSDLQQYTFGFSGISASGDINVSINLVKYFGVGGSSFIPVPLTTFTLTSSQMPFSIPFLFGDNLGYTIGTGETYVAIDVAFSTSVTFDVSMTDFVLLQGSTVFADDFYPVQTDADTLTRGVAGWMTTPDPFGQDLYLPLVLTSRGMTFDHSIIGKVEMSVGNIVSPNSLSPLPLGNDMPCDGASYLFNDFSSLHIPYSRLGDFLISNSPISTIPMYGTGDDFITAYKYQAYDNILRLTVNSYGSGITAASDGNTGWTIGNIVTYGASSTGSNSLNYKVYNNVADTLLAIGGFTTPAVGGAADAGTSPFTVTLLDDFTGLLSSEQNIYTFTIVCTDGASLVTGSTGLYFTFGNATQIFRIWYQTGTETPPSGGLYIYIEADVSPTATAQDIANVTREIMSAYQISNIDITTGASGITTGDYWKFSANPTSPVNYYVWYNINNGGGNPNVPATIGIEIDLIGTETAASILDKTQTALNKVQYAAPDFIGMFPRGTDFSGIYDLDVAQRWSSISGLSGANLGTFEFQQFLSHLHNFWDSGPLIAVSGGTHAFSRIQDDGSLQDQPTTLTGGSETRPVNFYVNWCIKY